MPEITPELKLAKYNARWGQRETLFRRHTAPPAWAADVPVTPAQRARSEGWLPISEWLRDLRRLARWQLPSPAWLPAPLRELPEPDMHAPAGTPYLSLLDLWNDLPPALAGRTTFAAAELLPLLCALADPPRFGTDFGRYPEQLAQLRAWTPPRHAGPRPCRLLDLGCGTGQGTLEAANTIAAATHQPVTALGLTREPLEAWMATTRRIPHDPERERRLQDFQLHPQTTVSFIAGDACRPPLPLAAFDIILANGLVGGPFLHAPADTFAFLHELQRVLAPGGTVFCANHFHDGRASCLDTFTAAARHAGWHLTGTPRDLCLQH